MIAEILDYKNNPLTAIDTDGGGSAGVPYDFINVEAIGEDSQKQWQSYVTYTIAQGSEQYNLSTRGNRLLLHCFDGRLRLFRINNVKEDSSGPKPIKYVTAFNMFQYDLKHTKVDAVKWTKQPTSLEVFRHILSKTGWTLDNIDDFGSIRKVDDIQEQTTNAMDLLNTFTNQFGFEIDTYVRTSYGKILEQCVSVVKKRGSNKGQTIEYHHDMIGFTRTVDDDNFFTRLYGYDSNGNGIGPANNGIPYLENKKANDEFNQGGKYLEGAVIYDGGSDINAQALKEWLSGQLDKASKLTYTYEISADYLEHVPEVGDTVLIVNFDVDPALTISARSYHIEYNASNPSQTTVTFGDFKELKIATPEVIRRLIDNHRLLGLVEDVKSGIKAASVQLITPTGKSWSKEDNSKTIIARIFVDGTNLTSYLSKSAFIWTKTNTVTGVHDLAWEAKHKNDGYQVILDDGDVGNITCTIEGNYLKNEAELLISDDNSLLFDKKRVDLPKDHWGDPIAGAFQYQWYDEVNQMLITSVAYTEGKKGQANRSNADDTKYHRFKLDGTYVDSMIVQGGGHGSSFGAHLVDGVPEIWTLSTNTAGGNISLGRFKWVPNAVVNQGNGVEVVAKMPSIDGHWFRRISCDFEQGWVLSVMAGGPVEVLKIDDLLAGKWDAIYSFKIQQFGFNPVSNTQPNFNTMQSNDIHFPYMFINSGDANNKDPRILSCINVVTESEVFHRENLVGTFGDKWVDTYFEPETIGYYHDKEGAYVLQGFGMLATENDTTYLHRTLFKTRLNVRDDSGDKKNYIDKDASGEEEDVA